MVTQGSKKITPSSLKRIYMPATTLDTAISASAIPTVCPPLLLIQPISHSHSFPQWQSPIAPRFNQKPFTLCKYLLDLSHWPRQHNLHQPKCLANLCNIKLRKTKMTGRAYQMRLPSDWDTFKQALFK